MQGGRQIRRRYLRVLPRASRTSCAGEIPRMIIALGVFLAIAVGSCMQRVSGMGVGLITGPVISIFLGPVEGIMVLNILACINAAAATVTVRRNVQWRYVWLIGSVLVIEIGRASCRERVRRALQDGVRG